MTELEGCQGSELEEQEEAERGQPETGTVGQAEPGYPGLAGFGLVQHNFLYNINHLVDHHPVVVQRVAHSVHTCTGGKGAWKPTKIS